MSKRNDQEQMTVMNGKFSVAFGQTQEGEQTFAFNHRDKTLFRGGAADLNDLSAVLDHNERVVGVYKTRAVTSNKGRFSAQPREVDVQQVEEQGKTRDVVTHTSQLSVDKKPVLLYDQRDSRGLSLLVGEARDYVNNYRRNGGGGTNGSGGPGEQFARDRGGREVSQAPGPEQGPNRKPR